MPTATAQIAVEGALVALPGEAVAGPREIGARFGIAWPRPQHRRIGFHGGAPLAQAVMRVAQVVEGISLLPRIPRQQKGGAEMASGGAVVLQLPGGGASAELAGITALPRVAGLGFGIVAALVESVGGGRGLCPGGK